MYIFTSACLLICTTSFSQQLASINNFLVTLLLLTQNKSVWQSETLLRTIQVPQQAIWAAGWFSRRITCIKWTVLFLYRAVSRPESFTIHQSKLRRRSAHKHFQMRPNKHGNISSVFLIHKAIKRGVENVIHLKQVDRGKKQVVIFIHLMNF